MDKDTRTPVKTMSQNTALSALACELDLLTSLETNPEKKMWKH